MDPRNPSHGPSASGRGAELWLLVPGPEAELGARAAAFADVAFGLVLAAPGAEAWGRALARGRPIATARELAAGPPGEDFAARVARTAPALERARTSGAACVLLVLARAELLALLAHALDLPLEREPPVQVDPGRAVLLRDEQIGFVLRRTNAAAPLVETGTALPTPRVRP